MKDEKSNIQFKPAPVFSNEHERLKALDRTGAMYVEQDQLYDVYCYLAKEITGCPVSWTGLIDSKNQFCLASDGFPEDVKKKIPREQTFCQYALNKTQPIIIENMNKDERFKNHPLVKEGIVKFYAAFPVVTQDGYTLGTLCVSDNEEKKLDKNIIDLLLGLSTKLAHQLEIQQNFKTRTAENLILIIDKIINKIENVSISEVKTILKFFSNQTLDKIEKDFLINVNLATMTDNSLKITEFGNHLKNELMLNTGIFKRLKNMSSEKYDLNALFDEIKDS